MGNPNFVPGHNKPGPGRPKGSSSKIEWCEEYADGPGKQRLIDMAESANGKIAFQALALIFAYGKGKPKEKIDLDVNGAIDIVELVAEARAKRGLVD